MGDRSCLRCPAVGSVILGACTLDQLTVNLPAGLQLSTEETALLDEVSAPRVDFPYGGTVIHQMTPPNRGRPADVIIGRAGGLSSVPLWRCRRR
jgi:hypothetical protein